MKVTNSDLTVPVAYQLYLDGTNLSFTLSATVSTKKTTSGDASNPIVVPGSSPAISASGDYSYTVIDKMSLMTRRISLWRKCLVNNWSILDSVGF